ncbi:MAG: valine--tRNA ligase, partial [Thermoflexibacter sp.]|nr:valine--tRNA ligase [Thermoflexibacter sp.]
NPDKEPYTIVIPPPNVTGVLHMGHMLNNTIQDTLIRKARMEGKEACWVPGTDHASIATEAKVVQMLKDKGIEKKDISREEFLKHAWEWKEKYGGIILEQLKKLGASCDWDRTRFTMEEALSEQVIKVFVDLYRKGLIYRGARMINWDPQGKTALSDDEVNYKETKSKLYYVKYKVKNENLAGFQNPQGLENEYVIIATQRPETIMGDTAVCVNPNDERYKHLKGKKIIVPLVNREVPVIFDEYVDVAFGTGALKVTPAHDINDYNLGLKHNLEVIDTLNDDGTLSEAAQVFVGTERFKARKLVAKALEEQGLIVKIDEYTTNIGYSERTDAVVEPRISTQWFVEMKKLCEPALENVMNDNIKLHPPKFKNMYRSWMENVRDWCISRQLWWGHRIPAWYLPDGTFVVAHSASEALALAQEKEQFSNLTIEQLTQDEDVLDTWFSSGLWPIAVFDGILNPDNEDINYYYPTNDLVTAPEILFFWVARMILFGYEYKQEKPYSNVYLTGIVRDKQGRKMSKQLGNSPDPLVLIEKYGADGIRTGMLFSSPAGNDLLFDEKLCEQGRNFTNKIWNAFRLVQGWQVVDIEEEDTGNSIAIKWFEARMNDALIQLEEHYANYRISDALMTVYKLVWDDFCSWYLEMIKPDYQGEGKPSLIDKTTYETTIGFFESILKIVHPFMPFITEELWHALKERGENECIIVAEYPQPKKQYVAFEKVISEGEIAFDIVRQIREMRNSKGMSPKEEVILYIKTQSKAIYNRFKPIIRKLANLSAISFTSQTMPKSFNFVVKGDEFFIPLKINVAEERARIEKELEYNEGFLESVNKKLSNEKFVQNAKPEIIATEKQKKADAEAKIKALKKALEGLK